LWLLKQQSWNFGCCWPQIRIFLKQQNNQPSKLVAVGEVRRDRVILSLSDLALDLLPAFTWKCCFTRAQLIDNAAESKQVTTGVVRVAFPYFWSDVAIGSADCICFNIGLRPEVPGETEVAKLYLVTEQEKVLGLEVVVDDLSTLQIVECRGNLLYPVIYLSLRKDLS